MKLFVTGVFRTGSTVILQILNVNKDINITYDTVHFMRFCYKRYGKEKVSYEDSIKMVNDVNNRLIQRDQKGLNVEKVIEKIKSKNSKFLSYSFLYDEMMKAYVDSDNWGDRTTLQWRSSTDLLEMYDDMHILHVIRDPRDLMVSWKKITTAPGNDYLDAIANCYDSMEYALKNQEKYHDKYHVVKFEDVINNPKKEIKELCSKLGLTFNEEMLYVNKFKSKMGGRWDPNHHSSFKDIAGKISTKPIGRWKKHLSSEDLFLIELALMDIMKKFDYALSDRKWESKEIIKAFEQIFTSPLSTESYLNLLKNKKGVERYPQDPLNSKNWVKIEQ